MPGDVCIVCGNTREKDPSVSMHHLLKESAKKDEWIKALNLDSSSIKGYHRVCSRHFPNADPHSVPDISRMLV